MADFVFKRYELKYLLNEEQYRVLLAEIEKHLSPDPYGNTTVQSLYYDTPDFRLVRESIEKPVYKEKLRLRCYGRNDNDRDVYLEMKRKYDGVVYKRRIACKESEEPMLLQGKCPESQIGRELSYFISRYPGIRKAILILYDRMAFFEKGGDLRVTFDRNIRYRTEDFSFASPLTGETLLPQGYVIMELKCAAAYPLWLTHLLCREEVAKGSFSKYGEVYTRLLKEKKGNVINSGRSALC